MRVKCLQKNTTRSGGHRFLRKHQLENHRLSLYRFQLFLPIIFVILTDSRGTYGLGTGYTNLNQVRDFTNYEQSLFFSQSPSSVCRNPSRVKRKNIWTRVKWGRGGARVTARPREKPASSPFFARSPSPRLVPILHAVIYFFALHLTGLCERTMDSAKH